MLLSTTLIHSFLILATATRYASAHGYVHSITLDGATYQGQNPFGAGSQSPIWKVSSNSPASPNFGDINGAAMACGGGSTAASQTVPVTAGSKVSINWVSWPHNTGPIITYLGACDGDCSTTDPTKVNFFKIDQVDFEPGTKNWVVANTLFKGLPYNFTLPEDVPSGKFIMRHEVLALQNAQTQGLAEFYPQCINVDISCGTGVVPSATAKFPGGYSATDPGILLNVYDNPQNSNYVIPGPPMALQEDASEGNNGTSVSTGSDSSTSTLSTAGSTVEATITSSVDVTSSTSGATSASVSDSSSTVTDVAETSPLASASTTTSAAVLIPGSTPPAKNAAGGSISPEQALENGQQALALNKQFQSIKAGAACSNNDAVCAGDQFAQCGGGILVATSCAPGTVCAALPLVNKAGTSVTCTTPQDRDSRIALTGATAAASSINDATASTPVASASTTTSASSSPPTTNAAGGSISPEQALENGQQALALNQQFQSIKAGASCSTNEVACAGDQFAQCNGGVFVTTPCAAGTICAALPLVNKAGTSVTCTTPQDRDARIARTGATAGASSSNDAATSSPVAFASSTTSPGLFTPGSTPPVKIATGGSISPEQALENGQQALALNKQFQSIKAGASCSTNEVACAGDQFAQCNGGVFVTTPCAAGTICAALPLVNKAGTSVTCTTPQDRDSRIALTGAIAGASSPNNAATSTPVASATTITSASSFTASSTPPTKNTAGGSISPQQALENGQQALALNQQFQSIKAGASCSTNEVACAGDQFAQCSGGVFVTTPCAAGTICAALPLVNKAGTSVTCTTPQDRDARIALTGATAGASSFNNAATSSPVASASSTTSPGLFTPGSTPPVKTATGGSISPEQALENGQQAVALNKQFQSIKAGASCSTNEVACVGDQFAQCSGGVFVTTPCAAGTICAALPLVNKAGTSVTCTTPQDRDSRIALTGATANTSSSDTAASTPVPSVGTTTSAASFAPGSTPPAKNAAGGSISPEQALQNGQQAVALNKQFQSNQAGGNCANYDIGCAGDEFAQCVGGTWVTTPCASGTVCAALPLVNKAGTSIACTTPQDRDLRISLTGATARKMRQVRRRSHSLRSRLH